MLKIRGLVVFLFSAGMCLDLSAAQSFKQQFDVSYGFGTEGMLQSTSWKPNWGFFYGNRLRIGPSLRHSFFWGDDSVSLKRVDGKKVSSNPVSLDLDTPKSHSINAGFEVYYALWDRFEFGMNLDLVGTSLGREETATYRSGTLSSETADVPPFNLFLYGKRDIGHLNSEFFLGYRCENGIGLRAGLNHFLTEFESARSLDGEDRFRRFLNFYFASLSYRF